MHAIVSVTVLVQCLPSFSSGCQLRDWGSVWATLWPCKGKSPFLYNAVVKSHLTDSARNSRSASWSGRHVWIVIISCHEQPYQGSSLSVATLWRGCLICCIVLFIIIWSILRSSLHFHQTILTWSHRIKECYRVVWLIAEVERIAVTFVCWSHDQLLTLWQ